MVGLLISSYALCQLIAGPILGRLSDTMGRKPLLIVSQIGTLIGFLILAAASSLWLVFLSRIIDGVTAGNLSQHRARGKPSALLTTMPTCPKVRGGQTDRTD